MPDELLNVNIQASRKVVTALSTAQLLYLLLDIRSPADAHLNRLPLNLCLVIDRSTSMRGERLDRVKAAAALIVEKLSAHDVISVVTFSDRAEVVLPASRLSNKIALLNRLKTINAAGGTEIYHGLAAGLMELRKATGPKRINQLVLLTDGHTYGDTTECLEMAAKAANEGIGMNAFGIGAEWNDQFLDRLVAPSGGQSGYIETPAQIIEFLQNCIQGLGAIYAQNIRLAIDLPLGVQFRQAFKVAPFPQPLSLSEKMLHLGALESNLPLTVLLELVLEPQLPGKTVGLPLHLSTNIPSQPPGDHLLNYHFELRVIAETITTDVPEALVTAVRALNFYRMNEQAWQEMEEGLVEMATMRLRRLTTRLFEAGHTQLAEQAQSESERLATMGTISLEGRKKLKYGTRSLMGHTFKLDAI
jgi:Ca-activated chloride channel homolog